MSGSLTGILYWFSLHFPNGATISTAGSQHSGQVYTPYCIIIALVNYFAGYFVKAYTLLQ